MTEFARTWWQGFINWAAGNTVTWADLILAAIFIAVALIAAFLFSRVISRALLRFVHFSHSDLEQSVISAARGPVSALIVLAGVYLAIIVALHPLGIIREVVDTIGALVAIAFGALLIIRVSTAALRWLEEYMHGRDAASAGGWALPLVRRGVLVVVIAMGTMISMDVLGVNITPLVAGLGIGGLAIALALQPTLANLFAGTYVTTENVVGAGDYIEMEDGVAGFVVDVNWRSTRLRTRTNNLVVIPNSRFAEAVITNYNKPDDRVNVRLTCGVSYDSDLQRVEEISREVMETVQRDHPAAVEDFTLRFFYDAFGDSNIDFLMVLQATDRLSGLELRSELLKQLHARFVAEGITINYPVRTLQFPSEWSSGNGRLMPSESPPGETSEMAQPRGGLARDIPGGNVDGPDI